MTRRAAWAWFLAGVAGACSSGGGGSGGGGSGPVGLPGVPYNGYPNYQERLLLVAINRARADPNRVDLRTKGACSTDYPAQPPLAWSYDGSRAARFHCQNLMLTRSGLSHNSFCTLRADIGTTGCDGAEPCACEPGTASFNCDTLGGHGTDPTARGRLFDYATRGEVGAAGYVDGWSAVEGWVTECTGADGHRRILVKGDLDGIGLGYAAGSGCWPTYYFGDLTTTGEDLPVLPAGAHRPETGARRFDFHLNVHHPGRQDPSVDVVVDGHCNPMTLEAGLPASGTYRATVDVGDGCHAYRFLVRWPGGGSDTYPALGSYGVGTCTDYRTTAAAADCQACPVGMVCPGRG